MPSRLFNELNQEIYSDAVLRQSVAGPQVAARADLTAKGSHEIDISIARQSSDEFDQLHQSES